MWGKAAKSKACVERFVRALNAHDIGALSALMTDDFTYIDSWREGVEGKDKVLAVMPELFATDPTFGIEVDTMTFQAPHVLMAGRINTRRFGDQRRAVWRVTCEDGKISLWQSWADGGPPPMTRMLSPKEAKDMSDRAIERPELPGD